MRQLFLLLLLVYPFAILVGCSEDSLEDLNGNDKEFNHVFDITEAEAQKWEAGFADYPVGEDEFYELQSGFASVPEEAGEEKPAFMLSGNNHSDDLFMFMYRKMEGLAPNTAYNLVFKVEFASNAPRNSVGVGGSPGSSVYLKAGALSMEPELVHEEIGDTQYFATNFDKGNQAQGGKDMVLLGNVGTELEEFRYTFVERTHSTPLTVTTNAEGELWIMVGTDSGFEATTTIYYTSIKVKATRK